MLANGENFAGRTIEGYRLGRVLGVGSTSTVYAAQPIQPGTEPVAIKVLTFHDAGTITDHAAFRRRFLREARAARKLKHPHILPVLSFGESDGLTYMIMPLIESGTLASWLAAQPGPLPLSEAADVLRQTAEALDYAHSQGIVHRDIKPSNLLLGPNRSIFLSDFGIARLFDTGDEGLTKVYTAAQGTLTQTGEVLGTPYYMAPEQIKGEPISPASDVYALGIVLYLMVTGQVPFQGETALSVALQHLQEDACPPRLLRSDLPPSGEAVMLRALAKQPEDRYASAGAFAEAFTEALATQPPEDVDVGATGHTAVDEATSEEVSPFAGMVDSLLGDYQLEALLAVDELGPVFAARTGPTSPLYRLRALPLPDGPAETRGASLGQFQQEAHEVAEVEHASIVPLLDYGSSRGAAYLVSPLPQGQPLATALCEQGPLDPTVVDRYLAQLAQALDYAHAHGIVHGGLSAETVYLGRRGELSIADFGVRAMANRAAPGSAQPATYYDRGAAAPEQLLGKNAEPATDVYALGMLVYLMLTGRPLFSGDTPDDIAQQHLHATPPPLRRARAGLPSALENILTRALAKEPRQRYARPGELAAAFHQILLQADSGTGAMSAVTGPRAGKSQSARVPVPSRPAAGRLAAMGTSADGVPPAPTSALAVPPRKDVASASSGSGDTRVARKEDIAAEDAVGVAASEHMTGVPPADSSTRGEATRSARASRPAPRSPGGGGAGRSAWIAGMRGPRSAFLALGGVVVVAALVLGLLHFLVPTTQATITFGDSSGGLSGVTDAASVTATGLASPPAGSAYYAWLLNHTNESFRLLNKLVEHGNTFTSSFQGGSNGQPGTNLLGQGYDTVEITLEQGAVPVHWPRGQVVLEASIPPDPFVHIGHLLVAFPITPNHVGYLVGLLDQTQRLDAQAQALRADVASQNTDAAVCEAQSIIDLIEGSNGPSYAPLPGNCAGLGVSEQGDGFGIIGPKGLTAGASDHANLAATARGATEAVITNAHRVETTVGNIDNWLNAADHAAWWFLHHPTDTSGVANLVAECDWAYHGHGGSDGGQTAYLQGQAMASLTLTSPQ